jgi:hypothetical protein
MSTYRCRIDIDDTTTISYNGGDEVTITHTDNYWGWEESSSISIKNIGGLIQALQDIQKMKYGAW